MTWLTAADIRGARFTTRRGSYAAAEVREFLEKVARVFEDQDQRLHQIHDQLSIAENDRRDVVRLRRELAAGEAELRAMADRVTLAETVRDEALQRLADAERGSGTETPALDAETLAGAEAAFEQLMHEAGIAAAQTRATADEEARRILEAAAAEAKLTLDRASSEASRMLGEARTRSIAPAVVPRTEPRTEQPGRQKVDALILLDKAEELMSAADRLPMTEAHQVLRNRLATRARRLRDTSSPPKGEGA